MSPELGDGAALFDGAEMATGYAAARPPVHEPVMTRAAVALGWTGPVGRVLDVGCGAGASTRAASRWATTIFGVDPGPAMVAAARNTVPGARFVVSRAEAMPIASASMAAIVAAGSLNFVALAHVRAEAARVLASGGVIVAYDFATGARSSANVAVERGFAEFSTRWPRPVGGRLHIDQAVLGAAGFDVRLHDEFVVAIEMNLEAYVDYLMTETNVSAAVARVKDRISIRAWTTAVFAPAFVGPLPIEFDAWYAVAVTDGRVS